MRIFLLRLALLLGAVWLLGGCPRPSFQPLAGRVAIPSIGLSGRTPARDTAIRGQVENARFRVQASFGEMAPNAVVTLLDPESGNALSSAMTNDSGAFTMAFPADFVPDPFKTGKYYTLEAVKGGKINGGYNFAGAPAIRLRTLMQWNLDGQYWMSLTGTDSADPVVINRSTTAVSVAVALRQAVTTDPTLRGVQAQGLKGTIDLEVADGTYPHKFSPQANLTNVTVAEFKGLFDLVDQALLNGQDPVGSIAWANQPSTTPRQYVLVPQGFLLTGFDLTIGKASTSVNASGAGFPLDANRIKVVFSGGAEARTLAINATGTQVTFEVPVGALTGPVTLKVTLPGTSSELLLIGPTFTITTTDGHDVVDASGSLWIAGRGNNTLWTLSSTGTWIKRSPIAIGWDGPRSLTLNPQGHVIFTGWNSGTVSRLVPPAGTGTGNVTPVASGLKNPWGIAREPQGTYLVANFGTGEIRRVQEGAGSIGIASVSAPAGVAIGPYGDAFVSSWTEGALYMLASTSISVPVKVLTGLSKPAGVAVQLDGTVAIACYGSDQIVRWHPTNGLLPPISPRGTHMGVIDVAADDRGRLYFGAFDSHTLGRIDANGTIADIALAPRNVWGLSANGTGDIAVGVINDLWPYGSRPRDSRIYIAPYSGGAYQPFQAIDGFGNPEAVAWDATGDLYVADADADRLIHIDRKTSKRTTLIDGIGRVAQLSVDAAGKVYVAALAGPLGIWNPAQPSKLSRFAPGRAFWAVARDPNTQTVYLGSPGDGQVVEIAQDGGGAARNVAALPGVSGLVVASGTLYGLVRDTGAIVQINTATGGVTEIANVGAGAADIAVLGTDFYVSMLSGAIKKVAGLGTGQISILFQITGGDHAVRLHARNANGGELYYTLRKAPSVEKLSNLGAPASSSVATFAALAGSALMSDPATESLSGLTGLSFDTVANLYVAQSVAGASRIFKLPGSFAVDQTASAPWLTLAAPVMGMIGFNNGNDILLAANPQEGTVATPGTLDDSAGFSINTTNSAVTSLAMALGRVMGVGLVPPSLSNFYLLASPALNSTAIALVTGGSTWKRVSGQAPCCGANHPFVDSSGTMYIPSYTGFLGVRSYGTGGTPGSDFSGSSFGAMSGVVTDARGGGVVAGSLGGGVANAPLVRFSAGQAAVALDNWPYEPGF